MPLKDAATLTGLTQGQLMSSTLFSTKTEPEGDSGGLLLINPKGYPFAKDQGYFDLAAKLRGMQRKPKKAGKKKIDLGSIKDRSKIDQGSINSTVQDQGVNTEKLDKKFAPTYSINTNDITTSNITTDNSTRETVSSYYSGANSELPKWAESLQFPLVTGEQWALTFEVIENLRLVAKESEIILQTKKALAWLIANPKRRKTPVGMPNFLLSWMNRARPEAQSVKSTGGFRAGGLL